MNILLLNKDQIDQNNARITGVQFNHLKKNHPLEIGQTLRVGMIDGNIGIGVIQECSQEELTLKINLSEKPPKPIPLQLILALPRPKMLRRILRNASMLGVKSIHLINSYNVEKSYWQSDLLSTDNIKHYLLEGLEQSIDTQLPKVAIRSRFKPFIEDELPALIKDTETLLAHPQAKMECPHALSTPITLAIGAERGFTDYETNKFLEAGFKDITLGQRILRVETALPVLIGKLFP